MYETQDSSLSHYNKSEADLVKILIDELTDIEGIDEQ